MARDAAGSRSGGEMTGNGPRATRWWWSQPSVMQGGWGQGLAGTSVPKRLGGMEPGASPGKGSPQGHPLPAPAQRHLLLCSPPAPSALS